MEAVKDGHHPAEAISLLIRANKLADACNAAADLLSDLYQNPSNDIDRMKLFFLVLDLIQNADISRVNAPSKAAILFFSAYAGLYHAIWNGFFEVLCTMSEHANGLAAEIDPAVEEFTASMIEQITQAAQEMQNKSEVS